MVQIKIIRTTCGICGHSNCPIKVYVEENKIIKVEGDSKNIGTKSALCPQALVIKEIIHSKNRITSPLIRFNKKSKFKKASWEEVLSIISKKLKYIKKKHGPHAVVFHTGYARPYFRSVRANLQKFANFYGSPNLTSPSHVCASPRRIGAKYVFGDIEPWGSADFNNSRCTILWGINPAHDPPKSKQLIEYIKKGRKLIVIDPKKTIFAKKSTLLLQPRPGTDGALALSMINVILENELYDKDFIKNWTLGFDELKSLTKNYSPKKVSNITWIEERDIITAATIYSKEKPSSIDFGNGLDQHTNNFNTIRAIASLIAITGNLDIEGGNMLLPFEKKKNAIFKKTIISPIGKEIFPLTMGAHLPSVWKAAVTGKPYKIRGMLIFGANPAITDVDSNLVIKALSDIDFSVVTDIFLNKTANLADIILPATTFLENEKYCRVVDPPGKAWSDNKIIFELGKKMGYDIDSKEESMEGPNNMNHLEKTRKYLKNNFDTPSGKVEFYSKTLKELGYDPLPVYKEPYESPLNNNFKEYPLILTTGAKLTAYTHSQFRNIKKLRRLMPDNYFIINKKTALMLEFKDNDEVFIESSTGKLKGKLKLSDDIIPNVVQTFHGFEEVNANILTSSQYFDPITGSPGLKSSLCKIYSSNSNEV